MYQQDWLDELGWGAIALGVLVGLLLQMAATFAVLQPSGQTIGLPAVVVVQACIGLGALVAGLRAHRAPLLNGLLAALGCALIALALTALRAPDQLSALSILFLFAACGLAGVIGGWAARIVRQRRAR
ncbi:MAG: TIGR04086 family membrane protein [Roseiflexaceae bacterium]|nr:TIGR04086 family membrane protein [Roseiflexaceae bacterium]